MKIKTAMSAVALAVSLGGCSSVPKPAVPDGSSRVAANDPTRVQAFQERVAQDRALLTENNLLRAQVEVLQQKLNEMTTIVREALVLPPAASAKPATAPAPGASAPQAPASERSSQSTVAPLNLPPHAYKTSSTGVVIRVFHPFARTEFEPSEPVAQALREGVRGAERIEVRGHTDSNVVNPIDRLIAIERASKARTWLIDNGAEAATIRMRFFSAGRFLAENHTPEGRSLNRRVEIDIRNPHLSGNRIASNG